MLRCDDCHEDCAVQAASPIVGEWLVILERHAFAASVLLGHYRWQRCGVLRPETGAQQTMKWRSITPGSRELKLQE